MSNKHLSSAEMLTSLVSGKFSTAEATQLLGLTTHSAVHGNTGRAPINRTDPASVERLRSLCGPVGCVLQLTDVYDRIVFPVEEPEDPGEE